jgi:UPF0755 protein
MSKLLKVFGIVLLIGAIVTAVVGYYAYVLVFGPNVNDTKNEQAHVLFIPTGAGYNQVLDSLKKNQILVDEWAFEQVAKQMNYPNKVYPGRYLIKPKMSNRDLVIMLRRGEQTPYNFTINNIRTREQFITLVGTTLEADSLKFNELLKDINYLKTQGFTPDNVLSVFMSDTYKFNWNTNEKKFFERMLKEYKAFWTTERKKMAEAQGLSPYECIILAAIVEEEVAKMDEMNKVAGVYLNRLRKDWPLQADPTIKFAVGDFTLKRILNKHLEVDSPYNTYKNAGLPPGPIRIPSKAAIKAVLNPIKHDYMYFCAKEDFSGYHNFAKTLREHNVNAKKYQRELNRKKIMK